jgi:hypothetical protein
MHDYSLVQKVQLVRAIFFIFQNGTYYSRRLLFRLSVCLSVHCCAALVVNHSVRYQPYEFGHIHLHSPRNHAFYRHVSVIS